MAKGCWPAISCRVLQPLDGLGRIWLVNENGKYEQTTDRDFLLKYFEIERLSR